MYLQKEKCPQNNVLEAMGELRMKTHLVAVVFTLFSTARVAARSVRPANDSTLPGTDPPAPALLQGQS